MLKHTLYQMIKQIEYFKYAQEKEKKMYIFAILYDWKIQNIPVLCAGLREMN